VEPSNHCVDVSTDNVEPSNHCVDVSTDNVEPSNHCVDVSTLNVEASTLNVEPSNHCVDVSTLNVEASTLDVDVSTLNVEPSNHCVELCGRCGWELKPRPQATPTMRVRERHRHRRRPTLDAQRGGDNRPLRSAPRPACPPRRVQLCYHPMQAALRATVQQAAYTQGRCYGLNHPLASSVYCNIVTRKDGSCAV
jgi:hypothetical protein